MIGQTISHYKILEKLGEGGMGVVYKAHDTKLDRDVALKFLPASIHPSSEELKRFEQEAKAISALNHANIATIYDVDEYEGQRYLVLEYIPGGTLKSKLRQLKLDDKEFSISEVVEYGIQMSKALAHAHQHGIIHRDVKTDNMMLMEDGTSKLTDFGLAKLRGNMKLTKTGSTVGTAAYMSPEQIRGEETDARSDIFSLGVVLYELVTSHLPFRGEFETALSYSILNENPPPVRSLRKDTPPALERIIVRCLEKEKIKRYQSAEEVVNALREVQQQISPAFKVQKKTKPFALVIGCGILVVAMIVLAYFFWPGKPSQSVEKSIAVLPFVDMSPQKDQDYFCDGMSEEIINRLAKLHNLRVPARTSAFMFKGKSEDIREIGSKLNVQTILEGSVRKEGDELRVTAQLINVSDGYHLWSETYDRKLKDVLRVQDEIALAISDELKLSLLGEEKENLSKKREVNPAAYEEYLKGHELYWQSVTEKGIRGSIDHFRRATEIDPGYAAAYAGLAVDYDNLIQLECAPPQTLVQECRSAIDQAFRLDSTLADAYVALGGLRLLFDWNWAGADTAFKKAIELSPNSPLALDGYACFLAVVGRLDEAVMLENQALEVDPLNPGLHNDEGWLYWISGRFDQAIPHLRKALELNRSYYNSRNMLISGYAADHRTNEALAEIDTLLELAPDEPGYLCYIGFAYGLMGQRTEAFRVLDKLDEFSRSRYVPRLIYAGVYLGLGQKNRALDELERSYEEHDGYLPQFLPELEWKPLRDEPRFRAVVHKMGLDKWAPAWSNPKN